MSSGKEFLKLIKKLDPNKIRGKFPPIITKKGIEPIKKLYQFDSIKKYFPFLYIESKTHQYLGIVIARQSSDLVTKIGLNVLKNFSKKYEYGAVTKNKRGKIYMIQYRFPNDFTSFKLIGLCSWNEINDFKALTTCLQQFQNTFLEKMNKIAKDLSILE